MFCDLLGEDRVFTEELMSQHTTFKIGGPADYFLVPEKSGDVGAIVRLCKKEGIPYLENRLEGKPEIMIIGEPVTMGSLAAAIEQKYHRPVRVLCPLEETEGILGENDRTVCGEEEIQKAL